ncbi:hypothetical protein GGR51DRAFT_563192 [Nemania sp. FL0031]|nr:hypothetical protein GGR51DRAFT_563192 [Nemania sp. FL0031]
MAHKVCDLPKTKLEDNRLDNNFLQASIINTSPKAKTTYRTVYDAHNDQNEENLPGTVVRVEGQKAVANKAANQAYDNAGNVLDFYLQVYTQDGYSQPRSLLRRPPLSPQRSRRKQA